MNLNVQLNWNIALSSPLIIKICKFHGELTIDQITLSKRKDRPNYYLKCRPCANIRKRRHYHKNIEKNRESERRRSAIFYKKHKEIITKNARKYKQKQRDELADFYIKKLINMKDAPTELIELKRMTLKLKRELRTHGQK